MATKLLVYLRFLFAILHSVWSDEVTDLMPVDFDFDLDDVCLSEFHVEKYTMASSDSYRDNQMTLLIFPEAEWEYAPHFKQDLCARQSKISLPYSCFKIHGPQTNQHAEGYLTVRALENEFSKKFYAVINGYSQFEFDAFFDYSLGFWVNKLDKYLQRIDENPDVLTSYVGLKWYSPAPVDKMFYSLIIQSPGSQKVFELMSFHQPDLSKYPNLRKSFKFMHVNELRASFRSYDIDNGHFPWVREDGGDIVPLQISFGCSDIRQHVEFYTKVMEAKLLHLQNDLTSNLDGHTVHYAFMQPVNDRIEIKYVQRPIDYTYGEFTTETYKDLLTETHNDRITSPVCGLDRWFDNHYGYNTLKFAGDPVHYNYMDRVLGRVLERGYKWRLYHTPYEDESPEGKYWMKSYGFGDMYTLYVFDANGQTIQMIGEFRDYQFPFTPPIYHKQWCYVPCPFQQQMGTFDPDKIYQEDTDDIVYKAIIQQGKQYDYREKTLEDVMGYTEANGDDEGQEANMEEVDIDAVDGNTESDDELMDNDEPNTERNKKKKSKTPSSENGQMKTDDVFERELDADDEIDEEEEEEEEVMGSPYGGEGNIYIATIAAVTIGVVACVMVLYCVYRCIMQPRQRTGDASQFDSSAYDEEIQALLQRKPRVHV